MNNRQYLFNHKNGFHLNKRAAPPTPPDLYPPFQREPDDLPQLFMDHEEKAGGDGVVSPFTCPSKLEGYGGKRSRKGSGVRSGVARDFFTF